MENYSLYELSQFKEFEKLNTIFNMDRNIKEKEISSFTIDTIFNYPTWEAMDILVDLVIENKISVEEILELALRYHNATLLYRIAIMIPGISYGRIAYEISKLRDCSIILKYAQIISILPIKEKENIIRELEKGIIFAKNPYYLLYFARIDGANIERLALSLLGYENISTIYEFARDFKTSISEETLKKMAMKVIHSKNAFYICLFSKIDGLSFMKYVNALLYYANQDENYASILSLFVSFHEQKFDYIMNKYNKNLYHTFAKKILKTKEYRVMIKFACNYQNVPYEQLIDRASKLYIFSLIDVLKSNNQECIDYAMDKLICLGKIDLITIAKNYVELKDHSLEEKKEAISRKLVLGA